MEHRPEPPALEATLKAMMPDGKLSGPLPPVHLWNPEHCGDIGMEIRRDGTWWHEGTPIRRERLVRLFSRILRVDEDGETYLVTPYEKIIVHVEDAPFLAVDVEAAGAGEGQVLIFKTNLGETAIAGPDAPIRVETAPSGEPSPYVRVRGRLDARMTRPAFYELAELAEPMPGRPGEYGVRSQGAWFSLGKA